MSIATSLEDGRYLLLNVKGHLYLEDLPTSDKGNKASDSQPPGFSLLFGGNTIAFAVQEQHSLLAVLYRSDNEVYLGIYEFNGKELQSLFLTGDDNKMHRGANTLLWVGGKRGVGAASVAGGEKLYIGVSDHHRGTILYHVDLKHRVLHLCRNPYLEAMKHSGAAPFGSMQYLGIEDSASHTLYFYDADEEAVVEKHELSPPLSKSNRSRKEDGERSLSSSSNHSRSSSCRSSTGHKNFLFFSHNNGSILSVYVTKGSVRLLSPCLEDFKYVKPSKPVLPRCANLTTFAPTVQSTGEKPEESSQKPEDGEKENEELQHSSASLPSQSRANTPSCTTTPACTTILEGVCRPPVVCRALSSGQVLVSMDQLAFPIQIPFSILSEPISIIMKSVQLHDPCEQETIGLTSFSTTMTGDESHCLKVIKYKYVKKAASLQKSTIARIFLSSIPPPSLELCFVPPGDTNGSVVDVTIVYTTVAVGAGGKNALVRCQLVVKPNTSVGNPSRHRESDAESLYSATPSLSLCDNTVVLKESFYVVPLVFATPQHILSNQAHPDEQPSSTSRPLHQEEQCKTFWESTNNDDEAWENDEVTQPSRVGPAEESNISNSISKHSRRRRRRNRRLKLPPIVSEESPVVPEPVYSSFLKFFTSKNRRRALQIEKSSFLNFTYYFGVGFSVGWLLCRLQASRHKLKS